MAYEERDRLLMTTKIDLTIYFWLVIMILLAIKLYPSIQYQLIKRNIRPLFDDNITYDTFIKEIDKIINKYGYNKFIDQIKYDKAVWLIVRGYAHDGIKVLNDIDTKRKNE